MEQINLNLIPGRALPVCHASQYDVGRTIRCNLFEGDQVFALATGDTAELHVRKPDDTVVTASLTIVDAQTYLDIVTTQQMDAVAGSNLCEIQLKRSGNTLGTLNFIMEVEADPMDEGIDSQSEIHDLQAQVDAAVGNRFYKPIDVLNHSQDTEKLTKILSVNLFPTSGYTDGKYLNYNTGRESTAATYFYTDYIFVNPLFTYYFKNIQSTSTHVCFYDADKNYVSGVIMQTSTPYTTLTIPDGIVYMRCSFLISGRTGLGLYTSSDFVHTAQMTSYYIEVLKNYAIKSNATVVLPANYSTQLPDLNDAKDNSVYFLAFTGFSITGIPLNMPYNIYLEPAILLTVTASNYKKQVLITNTGVFSRVYGGGSWGDWNVIKKIEIAIPNGVALIRVMESGIPCKMNLTSDVELYGAYISAKGSDYWANYVGYSQSGDRNDSGLYMHPHVDFNGNGHTISFVPSVQYTAVQRDFSPFNLGGDNILENVIINIGYKNCRYAIHDDFAVSTEGETIRKVTMIGTGVSPALLGSGVKPRCSYLVEDCICLDNQDACDILYHSSTQNVQAASFLVIRGCYCEKSINIKYVGVNQVETPCIVTNNKAKSITLGPGSGETPYQNMHLYAWNNVIEE